MGYLLYISEMGYLLYISEMGYLLYISEMGYSANIKDGPIIYTIDTKEIRNNVFENDVYRIYKSINNQSLFACGVRYDILKKMVISDVKIKKDV